MDSLQDILANRVPEEPPEVAVIKRYVADKFQESVKITVRERDIIISAPSASLAGTLRLRGPELARLAGTTKKLVFRIGH